MRKCIKILCVLMMPFFLSIKLLCAGEVIPAPNFKLRDISKVSVALESYKNKKPVLLFFWTTWCPYCRKELKTLNENYQDLIKDGWEVLAINIGEHADKVAGFLKTRDLSFKVLLDEDTLVANSYTILGVPTFVVVDKKGNIVFKDNYFPRNYKNIAVK